MDDINENFDVVEDGGHQDEEEGEAEDDIDIYEDLDAAAKDSDANSNIIKKFNRLFSPQKKKCVIEEGLPLENETDEEDVGLYDDLNTFESQLAAEELQAKVESLEQKCSSLDKQNSELKTELEKVNKVNLMLRRNISSIFKTAKAELERKERQLKDLQREHDALIFRRGAGNAKPLPSNASQHSATIPGSQILKKDSTNKGNLITIENETQCTFQMGPVSVSFEMENSDFHRRRLQRLAVAYRETEATKLHDKNVKETREKETTKMNDKNVKETREKEAMKLTDKNVKETREEKATSQINITHSDTPSENLEDGEVMDDVPNGELQSKEKPREVERRKDDSNFRRRSRSSSPSPSRPRSPLSNKRKRNSSSERPYLRERQNDRGQPKRSRQPHTPDKKSGRYRPMGNTHFKSRSNRR